MPITRCAFVKCFINAVRHYRLVEKCCFVVGCIPKECVLSAKNHSTERNIPNGMF